MAPEVTILMAVYNGMPYLPKAIESILSQTWTDFEFLIVDDASTDNSREIIARYKDSRIQLLHNEKNVGQTRALNYGLQHVNSELIARMDADDISHLDRLEKQVAYLRDNPEVAVIGTNARFIDSSGKITGKCILPQHNTVLRWAHLFGCFIAGGTVMFRKNVIWNKLEGFNPSITYAQDWELWLRVPPQYKLANLPEPLIDLRLHPNSSSLVFRHIMDKEGENIKRLNFRRMFSGTNGSEKWLSQINDLMDKCNNHPKFQLELIDMLFKQFCVLYPDASKNQEVLKHLSKQYFNVLSHTSFRSLSEAIKILSLAWPISPKKFYLDKTLRWMAACLGVRGTRDWIYERRKFFNAK